MTVKEILDKQMKAKVYFEKDEVYYVKVKLWGMSISGITVRESKKFDELWVQMPMFRLAGKFNYYVQFDKDEAGETFKEIIETKARLVVEAHQEASN
ncbi:hypothetical protein BH10PAT4_BH10PAT4_4840 [soil metagenome]